MATLALIVTLTTGTCHLVKKNNIYIMPLFSSRKQLQHLKDKLAKAINDTGVAVDQQMNEDLVCNTMKNEKEVKLMFPPQSFPHYFGNSKCKLHLSKMLEE